MHIFEARHRRPAGPDPGPSGTVGYFVRPSDALSPAFRVISIFLSGEPGLGFPFEPRGVGPTTSIRSSESSTSVCGAYRRLRCVFGSLIAVRFAATHPARVARAHLGVTPAAQMAAFALPPPHVSPAATTPRSAVCRSKRLSGFEPSWPPRCRIRPRGGDSRVPSSRRSAQLPSRSRAWPSAAG